MTRRSVTDEQYGWLWRRLGEVARRVDEGTIPFESTMIALQNIAENNGIVEGNPLPGKMTVGDRIYKILNFLRVKEESEIGHIMVDRAKEMNANLGQDDGEHILKYQNEIPVAFRGRVAFVFPDWRYPDDIERVFYVVWNGNQWVKGWRWLGESFWFDSRLLCREA